MLGLKKAEKHLIKWFVTKGKIYEKIDLYCSVSCFNCVAQRDSIPNEMNASDHRSKQRGYSRVPVAIMPSVGVGYCRHCW